MAITCPQCQKSFSKNSNLTRHLKEKHGNEEGNTDEERKIQCVLCDKGFKRKDHLKTHMDAVHFTGEVKQCSFCNFSTVSRSSLNRHTQLCHKDKGSSQSVKLRSQQSSPQSIQDVPKPYPCSVCNRQFKLKKHLNYHLKTKHDYVVSATSYFLKKNCPICPFRASDKSHEKLNDQMYKHYSNCHSIQLEIEDYVFSGISEFDDWKSNVEIETSSKFIKHDRHKQLTSTFACHRSGHFHSKSTGKRSLKIMGSSKINGFCPASIIAKTEKTGKIYVKFVKTHIGHKPELKHIFLTNEERERIAVKLAGKIPHEEILKEVRSSVTNSQLKRLHLLTKKDILNIEKSFNLSDDAVKHPYDPVSVDIWVDTFEKSEEKAVLFYKKQGAELPDYPQLKDNDFLLVFMTNSQKEIFLKYGEDVVCVDGTHGVNAYNFQLYTLLVLDNTREGIPVGFMISSRGDEDAMKIFFNEIKKVTGSIKSHVFMSDMDTTFFNAWRTVMGGSVEHLYCTWHVLRAWRKNIHSKVKGTIQKELVYKQLQALLCELDQKAFETMLNNAVKEWLAKEETHEFGKYFSSYYAQQGEFQKWSYCSRIHFGVNTNMALENFNKMLKYCYLRGKKVKRLDKTLCAILRLINDKLFDILIKSFKGKVVTKLKILRKRHAESLKLSQGNVFPQSSGKWQVLSSGADDFYTVTRIKNSICAGCSLQCSHCRSCFHQYQCSCIDNGIKNNMCKHIHLVAKVSMNDDDLLTTVEESNAEPVETAILQEISRPIKMDEDFGKDKEEFIADLIATLRSGITNRDQLTAVKDHVKSIKPMLKAMEECTSQQATRLIDRTPANANIQKQRRFVYIKRKNTKKPFQGTSQAENNDIAFQLLIGSRDFGTDMQPEYIEQPQLQPENFEQPTLQPGNFEQPTLQPENMQQFEQPIHSHKAQI